MTQSGHDIVVLSLKLLQCTSLAQDQDFLHEAEVEELDLPGADHGVGREQPV